jgi:hypothetical protein
MSLSTMNAEKSLGPSPDFATTGLHAHHIRPSGRLGDRDDSHGLTLGERRKVFFLQLVRTEVEDRCAGHVVDLQAHGYRGADATDFLQGDHPGQIAHVHTTVLRRSDQAGDAHLGQRLDEIHRELPTLFHRFDDRRSNLGLGELPNRFSQQFFSFRESKIHRNVPPSKG